MSACCSTFERAAEQQFSQTKATAELARYHEKDRDRRRRACSWTASRSPAR
jgi:hypothetical protein